MEIKLNYQDDENGELILSNNMLNNLNFVDLIINNKEYTVNLDDLYYSIKLFKALKEEDRKL